MRVIVCRDPNAVGYHASRRVIAAARRALARSDRFVLGLATGGTPLPLYGHLIAAFYAGELDFSRVYTFNLDEYVGLAPNHPQSYRYFVVHNLFRYLNVPLQQTHVPNGLARDLDQECARYEQLIRTMKVDLGVLGIGRDAHIAFNEPGSPRDSRTRVVALAQSTIDANARFFARTEDVPTHALSAGLSTIVDYSRELVLLATGQAKAQPVLRSLVGSVGPRIPASYLREHSACTFFVDQEAASGLLEYVEVEGSPEYLQIVEAR